MKEYNFYMDGKPVKYSNSFKIKQSLKDRIKIWWQIRKMHRFANKIQNITIILRKAQK